jgi:hypothetical protein
MLILGQGAYLSSIPPLVAKEFKFYKAEEQFEKAKSIKSDANVKKINLFLKGLDFYDEYVRKALKHKIDKNKIFSKLVADSKFDSNKKIEEVWKAFQSPDKLFPLKKMSELLNNVRADEILVRISKVDVLKESMEGLMSAIPVIVGVFSFLLGIAS